MNKNDRNQNVRFTVRDVVIINGNAGILAGEDRESVLGRIRQAFAEEGVDAEIRVLSGEALRVAVANACDSDAERIFIGGGDGTVNLGAAMSAAADKVLAILPMGTLNLYAQDLGIPLEPADAVRALVNGRVRRVDYAEVNGNLYLGNSTVGILPPLTAQHEKTRGASILRRYGSILRVAARLLWRNPRFQATLHMAERDLKMKVHGIVICNNAYHDAYSLFSEPTPIDSGKLTVYMNRNPTRRGMLMLALRLLLGTWRKDRDIEAFPTREVTIETRRRRLRTVTDGEILELWTPLRYRVVPLGLRVVVPKERQPE